MFLLEPTHRTPQTWRNRCLRENLLWHPDDLVHVRGQLDAIGKALSKVMDENVGRLKIAPTNSPRDTELGIGIDRGPGPYVAVPEFAPKFLGHVLFFRIAERPNFISLQALRTIIAHFSVMKFNAREANLIQELQDHALAVLGHAAGCANRIAFYQSPNDPCYFLYA